MNVQQIICINHKTGLLKEMYFETIAMSEGINEEDKNEIEIRYKSEKLEGDIPNIIYSHFKLKSGKYCFCVVKYNESYTEYFCHGLILDSGRWPFYPAQLIDSPVLITNLNMEDYKDGEMPVLTDVPVGNTITAEKIFEFARLRFNHGLEEMIRASVGFSSTGFYSAVFDDYESIPMWIAAVQMAFPVSLSHNISFTTYAPALENRDYMFQGWSGSSLSLQNEKNYFIFDDTSGVKGRPESDYKFMRAVNMGFLTSKASLDSFHKFIIQFDYCDLNLEIDSCYNLYTMVVLKQAHFTSDEIYNSFDFATKYGQQDVLDDIFQSVEGTIDSLINSIDYKAAVCISNFLFKTSLNSNKFMFMSTACRIFHAIIDYLISLCIQENKEYIMKLYSDIKELCGERVYAILRYSVNEDRINYLIHIIEENCTPHKAELYLRIIFKNSIELGQLWNQMMHIKDISILIDMCMVAVHDSVESIATVLCSVSSDDEYFSKVSLMIYNRIKSKEVADGFVKSFTDELSKMDDLRKLSIRKYITPLGGGGILLEEYRLRLNTADNKACFFDEYCKTVFDVIKDYEKQFFSEAVIHYFNNLERELVLNESLKLIGKTISNEFSLTNIAVATLIKGFEETFQMEHPDEEMADIVSKIKRLKKTYGVTTVPDITGLVDYGLWLEKNSTRLSGIEEVLSELPDVERLEGERYKRYLKWCLPIIIDYADSAEGHKHIIRKISTDNMSIEFYTQYVQGLKELLNIDRQRGIDIITSFAVYYFYYFEPRYKILEENELLEKVKSLLFGFLLNNPVQFIKEIDEGIKRDFKKRGLSVPLQWKDIYNKALENRDTSLIRSFMSIFKK